MRVQAFLTAPVNLKRLAAVLLAIFIAFLLHPTLRCEPPTPRRAMQERSAVAPTSGSEEDAVVVADHERLVDPALGQAETRQRTSRTVGRVRKRSGRA
jgi:hypothetical protein